MPPYFAQYLSKNYLNGESIFENSDNNFFNNIMNNQFSFEIKRTNTEKQNKNFINALFNQLNNMKKTKNQFLILKIRKNLKDLYLYIIIWKIGENLKVLFLYIIIMLLIKTLEL